MSLNQKADSYFEQNKPIDGLGRSSMLSGIILVAARGANIILQVASMVLLARLLSPQDFGIVAMVIALVGFGPVLIDLGTTDAAVQKAELSREEASSLFWLNAAIGTALTLLLAASGSIIAAVYGEPALADIALLSSLTFIPAALSTQHTALMRRAMQFRRLAAIDLFANLTSSLAGIALALAGYGYWALVAKPILAAFLTAGAVWAACPWLPGRPKFTSQIWRSIKFGLGVTGFTITDYLSRSADRLALGYFFGAGSLGYYQNAFLLYSNVLSILADPLHNIAVSSLSKLRDNLDEYRKSWAAALSALTFLSSLAFAALAVTGQDFIVLLFGEKWAPAGPLLCVFAVRGIAQNIERSLGWLHVSAGRSDRWMRWGIFSAICTIAALCLGLAFGIMGVAVAYAIVAFALFIPALVYAGQPLGIGTRDVIATVVPQAAAGLIAALVGLLARHFLLMGFSEIFRLIAGGAICTVVYLVVAVGIFRVTEPLRMALALLRSFTQRQTGAQA